MSRHPELRPRSFCISSARLRMNETRLSSMSGQRLRCTGRQAFYAYMPICEYGKVSGGYAVGAWPSQFRDASMAARELATSRIRCMA